MDDGTQTQLLLALDVLFGDSDEPVCVPPLSQGSLVLDPSEKLLVSEE